MTSQTVEPANIVTALKLVRDDARKSAAEKIRKRIEAAKKGVQVVTTK